MKTLTTVAATIIGGALLALPLAVPAPDTGLRPETVTIPPGPYVYRPAGEFRQGRRVLDPPLETRRADAPLEIMKYPVSRADYARCAAAGACAASAAPGEEALAQVDVSFGDAEAYAAWLSAETGEAWRLPTGPEWARAAAERFVDAGIADGTADDPASRWLAAYASNAAVRGEADLRHYPQGAFGQNSLGVADIGGNVWEWTSACFLNGDIDAAGRIVAQSEYCGVRAAEGRHRAFVIDFVRDAKRGGCAVGLPPDYLGFRLVRDASG